MNIPITDARPQIADKREAKVADKQKSIVEKIMSRSQATTESNVDIVTLNKPMSLYLNMQKSQADNTTHNQFND